MVHHAVMRRASVMLVTSSVVLSLLVNIRHVLIQPLLLRLADICKTHSPFQRIVDRFEHVAGRDLTVSLGARRAHTLVRLLV